jgi:hypothetical protein
VRTLVTALGPRRRASLLLALPLCASLALGACRGRPQPSADFAEASQRFNRLYGQRLDGAYTAPEMADIEAQLARVPADSLDAASAQALLTRIREGRAQAEARQNETEAALAQARTPLPGFAPSETRQPEPELAAAPDAGAPDAGTPGPQVGTAEAELVGGFRGCFVRAQRVEVVGRGPRQTWELQGSSRCRLEYAALADSLLVVEEAKVLMVTPKSALQYDPPDAGR